MIEWFFGFISRVFKVVMIPFHFVMFFVAGCFWMFLCILNIPIWIVTGKACAISRVVYSWFKYHGDCMTFTR